MFEGRKDKDNSFFCNFMKEFIQNFNMLQTVYIQTPLGTLEITGDENGIQKAWFVDGQSVEVSTQIPETLKNCATQFKEFFEGKRKKFEVKLNPKGTAFQQKVWDDLLTVPFGKTESYLTMSRRYGDEKAIRAIASANGQNPVAIIIPCHRIVGSDGSLTGYAGGLWRKKWLIEFEQGSLQTSLF